MAREIYVNTAGPNGDGSKLTPCNSLFQALSVAGSGDTILLTGMVDAAIDFVNRTITLPSLENLTVTAYGSGDSGIKNFLQIRQVGGSARFNRLILKCMPAADKPLHVTTGSLALASCYTPDLNLTSFPSDGVRTYAYVNGGTLEVSDSTFDIAASMAAIPVTTTNLKHIFYIDTAGKLVLRSSRIANMPANFKAIKITNKGGSADISSNTFSTGNFTDTNTVGEFALLDIEGTIDVPSTTSINFHHNIVKDVPCAINIYSNSDKAIDLRHTVGGDFREAGIVCMNKFIRTFVVCYGNVRSQIYFYNNTMFGGHYGVFAANGHQVTLLNCVFSDLTEVPDPVAQLPIGAPNTCFACNSGLDGTIGVSYCNSYNFPGTPYVSTMNGVLNRGAYLRSVDPRFINAEDENFEFMTDSEMLGAGFFVALPFMVPTPNIGASVLMTTSQGAIFGSLRYRDRKDLTPLSTVDMNVEAYVKARLLEEFPRLNVANGSGFSDIILKPLLTVLTPFVGAVENTMLNQTVMNAELMEENSLDELMANIMAYRKAGRLASGVIRFYLYTPEDFLITDDVTFSDSNDHVFVLTRTTGYTSEEVKNNYDGTSSYFIVDVPVEAAFPGTAYNLPSGSIVDTTFTLPSNVAKFTNPDAFKGGEEREPNVEFVARVKETLGQRNALTKKSIPALLYDKFEKIVDVAVIGKGHEAMERDVIAPYGIHIGGCVDTYVASRREAASAWQTVGTDGTIRLSAANTTLWPLLWVDSAFQWNETSGMPAGEIPPAHFSYTPDDTGNRFSGKETLIFQFRPEYVGKNVRVNYTAAPDVPAYNDYMRSEDVRIPCADYLVKHFNPAIVSFNLIYRAAGEITTMYDAIWNYINTRASSGSISTADIINIVYNQGATGIVLPFTMYVKLYNHKDSSVKTLTSSDKIYIPETASFIPGTINVQFQDM